MQVKIFKSYDVDKIQEDANKFTHDYLSSPANNQVYGMVLTIDPKTGCYYMTVTYR